MVDLLYIDRIQDLNGNKSLCSPALVFLSYTKKHMRYTYREGIIKQRSWKWLFVPLAVILCIAYALSNYFAPDIFYVIEPADATAKKLVSTQPKQNENRIYLPKISTDVPIVPVNNNEANALTRGAINREPNSGDPATGGNYVVVAHRLKLGLTPWQTANQSSFYHLSKLKNDDDIYVDFKGVRYAYKVEQVLSLKPDRAINEDRTENKQLTLYTAELSETDDTRIVIIANQTGKIVWSNGTPRLQSLD